MGPTNSDHSLEKSSNTHTNTNTHTPHTQTHSNTKFSDQYQSYSPITPIIDYSNNNSDIFSDYSLEAMNSTSVVATAGGTVVNGKNNNNNNSNALDNSVTYKSIMIIDVLNKQQQQQLQSLQTKVPLPQIPKGCKQQNKEFINDTESADNNNTEKQQQQQQQQEDEDTSVYINEIKFYNDFEHCSHLNNYLDNNSNRKVRNGIECNINNFYVLNNKNNKKTATNSSYLSNNQQQTTNNSNNDVKKKMLALNYVFDEKKIASYDITPVVKLKNCMYVSPVGLVNPMNSLENNNNNMNHHENDKQNHLDIVRVGHHNQYHHHHHHPNNSHHLNASKKVRVKISRFFYLF